MRCGGEVVHGERRCNWALAQVCCYRSSTDDRFTPISALYLKLIGSPERCQKATSPPLSHRIKFEVT
jgi:hypothetical protein